MGETDADLVKGHRDRLRARFRDAGPEAMPDYELLEMVLFLAIPRVDVKNLAKRLLRDLGSFSEVLGAPVSRLTEFDGIGESAAINLKIIAAAATRMLKSGLAQRPVLSSWNAVIDYCHAAMAFAVREELRILFLDKRNALIADEVQQIGTVDHTPVYPREVIKRALELSSTAIILVHNHPSGDPAPSQADIRMTREIVTIAKPLGITIHDHIIIGKNGHTSFRELKLI